MRVEELPFRWRNVRGEWVESIGLLYRPRGKGPFPLMYYAGYEAAPEMAKGIAKAGVAVVTPKQLVDEHFYPNPNPIGRGLKMDEALLRLARALPLIDDTRVSIAGGSAGGYMTLMMSAATFPLAGVYPMVPPVNLNYGYAAWRYSSEGIRALRADGVTNVMAHPGSDGISGLWEAVAKWHGEGGSTMWQWSPLAHLDKISCHVLLIATSADALVPMPQYGGPLVQTAIANAPDCYPIDPEVVCTDDYERRTLLDKLEPDDVDVHVLKVPDGLPLLLDVDNPPKGGVALPAPPWGKRWMVILLDEGSPTPDVGHFKHAVSVNFIPQIVQRYATPIEPRQLTVGKLELLADRWLGRDWVMASTEPRDLTDEELASERADIQRSLATYRRLSDEHEARLVGLAADLDPDRAKAIAAALDPSSSG